MLYEKNILITW